MASIHYTAARPRDWIEWVFWFALALYVAVLPISGTIALRNVGLLILVAVTLWQVVHRKLRLDFPLLWPWMSYALIALVSLTYAVNAAYSFGEIKSEFLYPLVIMVVAATWIRSSERFEKLVWLLVAGSVLFVVGSAWSTWPYVALVISGRSVMSVFKVWTIWGAGAWTNGVGDTAATIVAVLPVFVVLTLRYQGQGKQRISLALWGLMIANLAALFLTLNRQSWICLAASIAVIIPLTDRAYWTRQRTLAAATMAMILVGLAYAQFQTRTLTVVSKESLLEGSRSIVPADGRNGASDVSANSALVQKVGSGVARDPRIELWSFCLARIAEHPWSGGGFGREAFKRSYPVFMEAHLGQQLWHAHNMVLNKGVQMGLPGIAAFLLLWGAALTAAVKGLRQPQIRHWAIALLAMMTAVFLRSMTDDFFIRDHAQMFWLMLGAFLGCSRQLSLGAQGGSAR